MSLTSPRSAFPVNSDHASSRVEPQSGMTLREYYIAHAPITLQDAFLVCGYNEGQSLAHDAIRMEAMQALVQMRAEYADAMLAQS